MKVSASASWKTVFQRVTALLFGSSAGGRKILTLNLPTAGRTAIATYGRNWQIDFTLFYSSVSLSKVRQNYTTKIWQASKNGNFDQKSNQRSCHCNGSTFNIQIFNYLPYERMMVASHLICNILCKVYFLQYKWWIYI